MFEPWRREQNEPRLVVAIYGPLDWWVRRGHGGPGWSVRPASHRVNLGDRTIHHVPFTEREGIHPARHVLGLCIRWLPPTPRLVSTPEQVHAQMLTALKRWEQDGGPFRWQV